MSLFGTIQIASTALHADAIGLQVVGQNIANASTPGYVREELVLAPGPTQRQGNLFLGMGVRVQSVIQKFDQFLEDRLRRAMSDSANTEAQETTYKQLESLLGTLSDTDLNASMTSFFSSVSGVLNQPESVSARNLTVLQGTALAQSISHLSSGVRQIRSELNDQIIGLADGINRLVEQIRLLNVRISSTEGGNITGSQAVGLRDQRNLAIEELAKIVNIDVQEQDSGAVDIHCGSALLVSHGVSREVEVVLDSNRGLATATIQLKETDAPLEVTSGQLKGLTEARDTALGGFLDKLDNLAKNLIFEFNKVHSSGQGLHGYASLTSTFAVDSTENPLNNAGLEFTPTNGSFQITVRSKTTGLEQTYDIPVDLNGVSHDMTLDDLAAALDAIDGLQATVTPTRQLTIESQSSDADFSFANDTSGILAALGINTFFTGSTADDIAVSATLKDNPAMFAASGGGVGKDTAVAVRLAALASAPIAAENGESLTVLADRLTGEAAQQTAAITSLADGNRAFVQTLEGQKLAISGVNLDEEAISMLSYQKSFQASARLISTIRDLLDLLASL